LCTVKDRYRQWHAEKGEENLKSSLWELDWWFPVIDQGGALKLEEIRSV